MDSVEKQIINAVAARLALITTGNGFITDAGTTVFRGRVYLTQHDPQPALSVFLTTADIQTGEESRDYLTNDILVVGGIAKTNKTNPADIAFDMIADVKRALYLQDERSLGGLVQDITFRRRTFDQPQDGAEYIIFNIESSIRYPERYGDPFHFTVDS